MLKVVMLVLHWIRSCWKWPHWRCQVVSGHVDSGVVE